MTEYCQPFQGKKIVDYCHYCQEGLELGGADAIHLGAVLFERKLNVQSEAKEKEPGTAFTKYLGELLV